MANNDREFEALNLRERPRRNRKNSAIRGLVRETRLDPAHFVLPLFIHGAPGDQPIDAMPGCRRLGPAGLLAEAKAALDSGVRAVVLFPAIEDGLKDEGATAAADPDGLVPRSVAALKAEYPELCVMTDVALDPYSSAGHDGLVGPDGRILNDATVEVLCEQALAHAEAGADVVAPSDMMDGRVGAIRDALDDEGHEDVSILSYTAKYASSFYGPFRGALDSAPKGGDKKTYQMDPANSREALRELDLDLDEGADMVMVKPALAYLDVIRMLRDETELPIAAYQVSGEYLMLEAAAQSGWLDLEATVLETLLSIRRAGADMIFTYHARRAADWLNAK